MASRNLDVAIRIQANLTEARNQIEKLRERLDQLGTTGKTTAENLKSTAAAVDKSAAALKTEAGAAEAAAKAHTKLAPAVDAGSKAMAKGAMSAAQYNMAMRQLPMQVTDIVTGLASGQSVFMVGIQQGGQLKDSFGGIAPAARAVLGAINPMVVGVAAGAGAFALIGKAVFDSYQELQGYGRALISTGNVAGTTAGAIADMADRVGAATGSYGEAEQAALALAQSGKVSGDTLEQATQAAVDLANLTGNSIESTTEQIIKLASAPSATLLKLNEQYHFLTVSVYEHVTALEAQGKTEEAATVAIEEFGRVQEQRMAEAIAKAGTLERAYRSVKKSIAEMWEGIKAIGRTDAEFRLKAAEEQLARLKEIRGLDKAGWSEAAERQAERNVAEARAAVEREQRDALEKKRAQDLNDLRVRGIQERKKAGEEWGRLEVSNLDKVAKVEKEIADIRALGLQAGKSQIEIERQVAAARARYAESLSRARTTAKNDPGARDQAAAERDLENLQKQVAMLGLLEVGEKRISEVERVRYEIEQGSYRLASEATKQQLLQQAAELDAGTKARADEIAKQQAIEKTTRAYETLKDSLRTPAEVQLDSAIERVETLNKALADGIIKGGEYNDQLGRTVAASFTPAPPVTGLSPEMGLFSSEETRLAEQSALIEQWYTQQLALLEQFRANKVGTEMQWNAQELSIEQQHQQALTALTGAQQQLAIVETASMFDSMAQLAKAFAGEQSATYKVLFAISKGFAIAQAAVDLASNVSKATAAGWPQNIPLIALALSQGATIASMLAAATYVSGGRIRGPGTGTSDSVPIWASNGEFMVRERAAGQPGALPFLEDFNTRGMAAIRDWRGFADGGAITEREPRSAVGDTGTRTTSVNNRMRVYLLNNEDELAQRLSQHPALEKAVVAIARQNGNSIRAEW